MNIDSFNYKIGSFRAAQAYPCTKLYLITNIGLSDTSKDSKKMIQINCIVWQSMPLIKSSQKN